MSKLTCDICGEPVTAGNVRQKRHGGACKREYNRRNAAIWRINNPKQVEAYNKLRKERGMTTLLWRVQRKYQYAPWICQVSGCPEYRVLDVAHKPEFKRDGEKAKMANCRWPETIWILCPTHHRIVDMGITTPEELGLN